MVILKGSVTMSGHSKWNNIKRKKEATDGAKAKVFTKIGREIAVCVKEGGGDPNNNSKLRDLIAKAKSNNVPNDNIDRIIKKAAVDKMKQAYAVGWFPEEGVKYQIRFVGAPLFSMGRRLK